MAIFDFYINWNEFFLGLFLIYLIFEITKKVPSIEKTKKRLPFFDIAKGIAIIAVVASHQIPLITETKAFNPYLKFAVPVFIMSMSYLLAVRYAGRIDLKKYYSSFFFRVVLIYLIFTALQHAINYKLYGVFDISKLLLDFVFGYGNYYFIPVAIQLYLLFPLLIKIKDWLKNYFSLSLVFLFSLVLTYFNWSLQKPYWDSNRVSLVFFGRFLFYFIIGIYLSEFDLSKIGVKKFFWTITLFVLGVFFISSSNYTNLTYLYPIMIFLLLSFVYHPLSNTGFMTKLFNILGELGKHVLIIYLMHTNFIYNFVGNKYFRFVFLNSNVHWAVRWVLLTGFAVIASYVVSKIFMYFYNKVLKRG